MISVETWYETHDSKLLAIVKVFKTWCHYLEDCKHEVLIFTDYNKLCQFMNIKSLSSKQVRWDQELFSTTSGSIIGRGKQTELPIPCLDILSKVLKRKKLSIPKTSKSSTAYCRYYSRFPGFQWVTSPYSIESSSVECMS